MPSAAEERIRAKVEALLRRRWPEARIVHELMLEQGGVRIDVAAIAPDRLVVAEIKSELDTLARAQRQIPKALEVADEVWFVFAQRHATAVRDKLLPYFGPSVQNEKGRWVSHENPDRVDGLHSCSILVEPSAEADLLAWPDGRPQAWPDPRSVVFLLWANEMRSALARHFGGAALPGSSAGLTRGTMAKLLVEHMSGRELRRAVLAQLRNRSFPRADPAAGDPA